MFTTDYNYLDIETRRVCGSMAFYFDNTIDENLHTQTAQEQQKEIETGVNSGFFDDDLKENKMPLIIDVCPVVYSETGFAAGVDAAVISNIILMPDMKQHENAARAAAKNRAKNTIINVFYRNI